MTEPRDYVMSDMDRGAVLALALLRRSDEVHEGEEEWLTTAEDIAAAVRREGLAATIRLQMDAETEFMMTEAVGDLYGPFPPELVAVAQTAPPTVWKGKR